MQNTVYPRQNTHQAGEAVESLSESGDGEEGNEAYRRIIATLLDDCTKRVPSLYHCGRPMPPQAIPRMNIDGIGQIAYPLSKQQANAIIENKKICSLAPFGLNLDTIVDTNVRKAWQIDPMYIHLNQDWLTTQLPKIVKTCASKLGIIEQTEVEAHFYKLLLYEEGGHFKRHKDTEKEVGMFGTLLIQLPAEHTGGALVIYHSNMSRRYSFEKDSAVTPYMVSFYADCDHKLEPITSGLRLVMAFNLIRKSRNTNETSSPLPPIHTFPDAENRRKLIAAVKSWTDNPNSVDKMIKKLKYKYTSTNFSWTNLKGEDRALAEYLINCKDDKNEYVFSVYAVLLTKHVTGTDTDQGYQYHYNRYNKRSRFYSFDSEDDLDSDNDSYDDPCEHEMDSDCDIDTDYNVNVYCNSHGAVASLKNLKINIPNESLDETNEKSFFNEGDGPDRKEYEGYQGNYAGSIEYWYHTSALIFWPKYFDTKILLKTDTLLLLTTLETKLLSAISNSLGASEAIQECTDALRELHKFQKCNSDEIVNESILLKMYSIGNHLPSTSDCITGMITLMSRYKLLSNPLLHCVASFLSMHPWPLLHDAIYNLLCSCCSRGCPFIKGAIRLFKQVKSNLNQRQVQSIYSRIIDTTNSEIFREYKLKLLIEITKLFIEVDGAMNHLVHQYVQSSLPRLNGMDLLNLVTALVVRDDGSVVGPYQLPHQVNALQMIQECVITAYFRARDTHHIEIPASEMIGFIMKVNDNEYSSNFMNWLCAQPNCCSELSDTIASNPGISSNVQNHVFLRAVIKLRLSQLPTADSIERKRRKRLQSNPLVFPNASVPDYPEFELFLRSERHQFKYYGSTKMAQKWLNAYVHTPNDHYSVEGVMVGGGSRNAMIHVTKTPYHYNDKIKKYNSILKEIETCSRLLGGYNPPVVALTATNNSNEPVLIDLTGND